MAWLESRKRKDGTKRYRIRDKINGEKVTVVKDAGAWKEIAEQRLVHYRKTHATGESGDVKEKTQQWAVEKVCDFFLKTHGPSLKGGVSDHWKSPYRTLSYKLNVVKRAWIDRPFDSIGKYDVRDFLARFKTTATVMMYLSNLSTLYDSFVEWNKDDTILKIKVRLPPYNPAAAWRAELKPSQKEGNVLRRVLSPDEWDKFKAYLPSRARAICEMALRRCLRLADIKQLAGTKSGVHRGRQAKTGQNFAVPVIREHSGHYDFTNFRKDFVQAQVDADMAFPYGHELHFTPRDLRRTGATWAYRETKNLVKVKKLLGHKKIETTMRYLNVEEDDVFEVTEAIDRQANRGAPVGNFPEYAIK